MDKFLSFLGLAMRAGKVVFGADMASQHAPRLQLVILASDAGGAALRNAAHICEKYSVPCIGADFNKRELGKAIGKKPCSTAAITDGGFAENLRRIWDERTRSDRQAPL